ncbi:Protein DDL-3 a [Aphelenchoides avenae]|nr:Protein DDL-3 a [Aphelenchus avenae]
MFRTVARTGIASYCSTSVCSRLRRPLQTSSSDSSTRASSHRRCSGHAENRQLVAAVTDAGGGSSQGQFSSRSGFSAGRPLLGLSVLLTLKQMLGLENYTKLDDDPVKDKIKQSMLHRKYGRYDEALMILDAALHELEESDRPEKEIAISRVLDELANTYYEQGDLDKAERSFRDVVQRLIRLHGKTQSSPEFIGISLKLADIFAQRGELSEAETGYRHCVATQMKVMEEHLKKFHVDKGALYQPHHLVEARGPIYTDPIALFGMTLEAFAHFLINNFGAERHGEAEEYIDEALKALSYHIFGNMSAHTVNILSSFAAACILRNEFKLARKYLSYGIDRIVHINDCAPLVVGYYCNYAEKKVTLWGHEVLKKQLKNMRP